MAVRNLATDAGDQIVTDSGDNIILSQESISGNAGFKWTPVNSSTQTSLLLNFPLKIDTKHAHRKQRSALNSLDFSARDVVVASSGVDEYEAELRFLDDPQALLEMVRDAQGGAQIDYYENVDDDTTKHQTWLIEGGEELSFEEERGRPEWRTTLRLRGMSAGEFDDLM